VSKRLGLGFLLLLCACSEEKMPVVEPAPIAQVFSEKEPISLTSPMPIEEKEFLLGKNVEAGYLASTFSYKAYIKTSNADTFWIVQTHSKDPNNANIEVTYLQLYQRNKEFQLVLDTSAWVEVSSFMKDTLIDANFDGRMDYVLKYYSPVGCCPRDVSKIYLNVNGQLDTDHSIELMNAHFDEASKSVTSTDYGFPEYNGLYKHVWMGNQLHLVESISLNGTFDGEGKFVIDQPIFAVNNIATDSTTYSDSLPKEYLGVYHVEWFYSP